MVEVVEAVPGGPVAGTTLKLFTASQGIVTLPFPDLALPSVHLPLLSMTFHRRFTAFPLTFHCHFYRLRLTFHFPRLSTVFSRSLYCFSTYPLSFHCFALTFHRLFTAFSRLFTASPLPSHCLHTAFRSAASGRCSSTVCRSQINGSTSSVTWRPVRPRAEWLHYFRSHSSSNMLIHPARGRARVSPATHPTFRPAVPAIRRSPDGCPPDGPAPWWWRRPAAAIVGRAAIRRAAIRRAAIRRAAIRRAATAAAAAIRKAATAAAAAAAGRRWCGDLCGGCRGGGAGCRRPCLDLRKL